jgi:signal transduction histidine kinase
LANTVSADAVESLEQKHAYALQGLRAQAARAQELETKLAKVRGVESSLRLEFDRQLAKEKRILSAKYDSKVNELRTTLESEIESRNAQINELETLRKLDSERHDKGVGVWRARDRKLQSGLLGLEEALRGIFPLLFLSFCSFASPPYYLIAPTGAFPDSNKAAAAALEEYRKEQEIVPSSDPKVELSSGELIALAKGQLHPVAKLGGDLREAIVYVFKTLWPGRAVPDEIQALLKWIPLAPNRIDV